MATITGTCSRNPTRYTYYATWSESDVNAANNTSLVTATLYIAKVSTYRAEGSNNPNTMYIDGTAVSSNIYIDLNPASSSTMVTVTILSGSKTITHDANGAKSITISASGTLPYGNGYGPQSGSLSGTATLTTITRATAVTTQSASSVTSDSATANGNVTDAGIPANTDKGIYWGTSSGNLPNKLAVGSGGTGAFTRSMTSLSPGTTYYYKAYSQNSGGYAYGSEVSFTTTAVAPTVTTQNCSSVTFNSATGNGNITATGGASVSRRGFCYKVGTSGDPTTSDSTAYDDGTFGTGAYTKGLTGLSASTDYRVRAYAVNSVGTSYGTTVQLTTAGADAPVVSTTTTSRLDRKCVIFGGNVTDQGTETVTERGIYYGTDEFSQTNKLTSTSGLGTYSIFLSGLTPNTKYYYKAFATSSIGTSYGDILNFTTGNSLAANDKTALPPFNRA